MSEIDLGIKEKKDGFFSGKRHRPPKTPGLSFTLAELFSFRRGDPVLTESGPEERPKISQLKFRKCSKARFLGCKTWICQV